MLSPFRYGLDPLALVAIGAYALNRWVIKPAIDTPFFHWYFNDILLIPAALPLVLWVQRKLRVRSHDCPPTWWEIFFHLLIWALIAEVFGPSFFGHGSADPWDVAAYTSGALLAGWWWNRRTPK